MAAAESLDGGGEDALDTDAVAAHDGGDLFAVAVEDGGSHGLAVYLRPSLKMWPIFDGFAETQGLAADGVEFAFVDVADVGDEGGLEVARGRDVAEVVLLLVGSGDEVGAAFEGFVEDDESAGFLWMRGGFEADGAEVACGALKVASISSATMGRSSPPAMARSLASLREWSPRRKTTTGRSLPSLAWSASGSSAM